MNAFDYVRAADPAAALAQIAGFGPASTAASEPDPVHEPRFIAGGTNLIDLMKEGVLRPPRLVDISRLDLIAIEDTPDRGLRLGAMARNADTAHHPLVSERYPLLRAAILAGASPQLRQMATNGGNVLQRTRCVYFYDVGTACNKRKPGSGCPAIGGFARQHAVLGASEHCIATQPSDMCVALRALDATVHTLSPRGPRTIDFADFHRLPGDRPELDTVLEPDELIVHIELPRALDGARSAYLKIRERASYAFAIVSVAALLVVDGSGRVERARIALGGVAHRPWRDAAAEELLVGEQADAASFDRAAQHLLRHARGQEGPIGNAHKIPLARRAVVRALEMARDGVLTNTGEDAYREEVAA